MSEQENNKPEASETEEILWPSPGEKVRLLREEYGYSEAKVADALFMTIRYVKALENDQYHILPGKTFVKGYYKAYATFLNANVDEVLSCYEQFINAREESEESEAKVIQARKNYDQNKRWSVCAAIIIIIVVAVSWWSR